MKNTILEIKSVFGEQLNSSIFTWQKYCGTRGISVLTIFDSENNIFNERFICEGWCMSNNLPCLSKQNGIAVMLWDKKEKNKVWCHISEDYIQTLIFKYKLKNGKKN